MKQKVIEEAKDNRRRRKFWKRKKLMKQKNCLYK